MGAGRFNCVIQSDANESLERAFHSGLLGLLLSGSHL